MPRQPSAVGGRSVLWSVYLPTFLFTVGQGAVVPVLPLFALELGATVVGAGFLVGLRGVGTMLFNIPAGMMASRFGERRVMMGATGILALVGFGVALDPSVLVFGILVLLMGSAWAIFNLARIAFVADVVPNHQRGLVMSTLGGIQRGGAIVGPLLGAAFAHFVGLSGGFMVQMIMGFAAAASLYFGMERGRSPRNDDRTALLNPREVLIEHRHVFATAGVAVTALQVLRSARDAAVPLWGERIGLSASQISTIFGAMSTVELALFYPVGLIMDRLGRKWVFIPAAIVMSTGLATLPLTNSFTTIGLVALLTGLGNGLSSGINLTLSSDFAPTLGRPEFLGVWRFITDTGTAIGPLVISGVTAFASLGIGFLATAGIGAGGLILFWRSVPETLVRQAPS